MSQQLSVEQAREVLLHKIWEGKYLSMTQVEVDVDALILAVRAEQQETIAGLTENLQRVRVERDAAIDGDLVDALKARAESAEQQLTAALEEAADWKLSAETANTALGEQATLHNGYLVQANHVGRAQVLAEVKALIVDYEYWNRADFKFKLLAKLDALAQSKGSAHGR